MDSHLWFVAGTLTGAVIAGPLTYFATLHYHKLNAIQAKVEAESIKSYHAGREAFLADLRVEQNVSQVTEGTLRKRRYLVLKERLVFKKLPITPVWETRQLIDEHLDTKALETVAQSASMLLGVPGLRSLGPSVVRNIGASALRK